MKTPVSKKHLRILLNLLDEQKYRAKGVIKEHVLKRNSHALTQKIKYIKGHLDQYELISFDIFDTAIFRCVNCYRDARRIKSLAYQEILEANETDFNQVWEQAYHHAHNSTHAEEVSQHDIFEEFVKLNDDPPERLHELIKLENEIELSLCYQNPLIYELYQEAKQLNKKIIFASDMYLSLGTIKKMLLKCGYGSEKIYLSSEQKFSKYSGHLFDMILDQEGISPDKMLHIGDNPLSDIKQAKAKGIHTFYFRKQDLTASIFDTEKIFKPKQYINEMESLCIGLSRKKGLEALNQELSETGLLQQIGYEIVGPMHLFYLFWIIEKAKELNLNKLCFLARDGYFLEKTFKKLKARLDLSLDATYAYASRRLYYLPGIYELDEKSLLKIISANQSMKVKDFITRLNLDPSAFTKELNQSGFPDCEKIITKNDGTFKNPDDEKKLRDFFIKIEAHILKQARDEREKLIGYYKSIGLNNSQTAIVDVGWNATSTEYIGDLFSREGLETPTGMYFGTWDSASSAIEKGYRLDSFFMHLNMPRESREIIKGNIAILELFFTAPHPTIIGLDQEGHEWKPIYENVDRNEDELQIVNNIFSGAEQFINDIIDLPGFKIAPARHYLETVTEKILVRPDYMQAKALGKFRHKISFGSVSELLPIAKEPEPNLTANEKARLLEESLWKNGTRAMLKNNK